MQPLSFCTSELERAKEKQSALGELIIVHCTFQQLSRDLIGRLVAFE
jgi:ssRNA-specific RNase YbeY (16S rRNA maturation enzyme)